MVITRGMATLEGPLLSLKNVNAIAHFTDWIIAHVHVGALGWNGFLTFGQKDIGFETFPPLNNVFGSVNMTSKFDALLLQNISGFKTETPLLASTSNRMIAVSSTCRIDFGSTFAGIRT